MPRKKKIEKRLTELVSFRLTAGDHQSFIEKLKECGLKPSEFFRLCLLKKKIPCEASRKPRHDNRRLLDSFEYASNKVNQLAHQVNSEHLACTISETTYREIRFELHSLCQVMKAVFEDVDQDLRRH